MLATIATHNLAQRSAVRLGIAACRFAAPHLRRVLASRTTRASFGLLATYRKHSIMASSSSVAPALQPTAQLTSAVTPAAAPRVLKPIFHIQPHRGWINDPNGPIFYGGKYHMFYQHYPKGSEWTWGLSWGHSISSDLVNWQHLPPALNPTPGSDDQCGVWSGCAAIDAHGLPFILNTSVRRRDHTTHLPEAQHDIGHNHIESQSCARPVDPTGG